MELDDSVEVRPEPEVLWMAHRFCPLHTNAFDHRMIGFDFILGGGHFIRARLDAAVKGGGEQLEYTVRLPVRVDIKWKKWGKKGKKGKHHKNTDNKENMCIDAAFKGSIEAGTGGIDIGDIVPIHIDNYNKNTVSSLAEAAALDRKRSSPESDLIASMGAARSEISFLQDGEEHGEDVPEEILGVRL